MKLKVLQTHTPGHIRYGIMYPGEIHLFCRPVIYLMNPNFPRSKPSNPYSKAVCFENPLGELIKQN